MDCQPVTMKKVLYRLERKRCPKCKKLISARPPGVLAKCLYSNQLLAYVAVQHSPLVSPGEYLWQHVGPDRKTDRHWLQQPCWCDAPVVKKTKRCSECIITNSQAKHPAIQKIQDIFREKADRLYHWADDRSIPADNNLAERELRPLVIARKISFGSQSDSGARTREILMTVLHTLKKRAPYVTTAFKSALDKLAEQSDIEPYRAIFSFDSS